MLLGVVGCRRAVLDVPTGFIDVAIGTDVVVAIARMVDKEGEVERWWRSRFPCRQRRRQNAFPQSIAVREERM